MIFGENNSIFFFNSGTWSFQHQNFRFCNRIESVRLFPMFHFHNYMSILNPALVAFLPKFYKIKGQQNFLRIPRWSFFFFFYHKTSSYKTNFNHSTHQLTAKNHPEILQNNALQHFWFIFLTEPGPEFDI